MIRLPCTRERARENPRGYAEISVVLKAVLTEIRMSLVLAFLLIACFLAAIVWMPGQSFVGAPVESTALEAELEPALRGHIEILAGRIGARSVEATDGLRDAERYLEGFLRAQGYEVRRESFTLASGDEVSNFEVIVPGTVQPEQSLVIGAHYDSVSTCPAANDNGSGVAAVLELARLFKVGSLPKTLRFVLFVNEEPPYFNTDEMGSAVYAKGLKARGVDVVGMFSLETMGWFSEEEGSQQYPFPFSLFYPSKGNFIAFVGNLGSSAFTRRALSAFRKQANIPSEGVCAPSFMPGVGLSDHAEFWREGYPAVMVTDTAPFRYPHYHKMSDTPDKVDYVRLARVTAGLAAMISQLGG